jgi:6-phosphogluconolactonase
MRHIRSICTFFLVASFCASTLITQVSERAPNPAKGRSAQKQYLLYIGSYTGPAPNGYPDNTPPSKGIYVAHFNAGTGELGAPTLAAEADNPSFLAASADHRFLYAISETEPEAFVTAYAVDQHTGRLRMLNKLPTAGAIAATVSLDRASKFVLIANFGSGSISVIQVEPDGSLGKLTSFIQHFVPRRSRGAQGEPPSMPESPHPHNIVVSPDNRFLVVPDLGLNKIFVYTFDAAKGTIGLPAKTVDLAPDEGPRHFVFSPDGKFGYLIAQTSGNVDAFSWDGSAGVLTPIQTAPSLPEGLKVTNLSAEIGISPNGKFLYESNRRSHGPSRELGPDSIVAYDINSHNGTLTKIQESDLGASIPRCFSIDPTGAYLLVGAQQDNLVEVYRIDPKDGKLSKTDQSINVHTPACMQFAPAL